MTETELAALRRALDDAGEACADALLTTVATRLVLDGEEPTPPTAYAAAVRALDRVIERTIREGGRPR